MTVRADASRSERPSLVGVPIAEGELTTAMFAHKDVLLRPGVGRVLIPIEEVDLGVGRPDAVFVVASKAGLLARAGRGLRLANLTEAQVLASIHHGHPSRHSSDHVRAVTRRLQEAGWLRRDGRLTTTQPLVAHSLLVEAKVKDWRNGLGQLVRTRWAAERSALLVPAKAERRVPRAMLRHNRIGLIVQMEDGRIVWRLKGRANPISFLADVWLGELAIRHLH